jgi:hypothetical protein
VNVLVIIVLQCSAWYQAIVAVSLEGYMTIRSSLIERSNRQVQSQSSTTRAPVEQPSNHALLPRVEPAYPLRPVLTSRSGAAGSGSIRTRIMARLRAVGGGAGASGRSWSQGVRAQAQARWGGALSTSQRVIVKAHVARHTGGVKAASKVLAAHVSYLARAGTGRDGEAEVFYGAELDSIAGRDHTKEWAEDRHHFRFIVSAEHGDKIDDLKAYMRETMQRVAADLKEPNLDWIAVNHFDTDQPHSHVLIRGRRADGRNLVIPRAVMGYGFRARAQEHAQELLGEMTREQAEVRLRNQITAVRETELDRHLSRHMDEAGTLSEAAGLDRQGSYAAMMRGRVVQLEKLGLASNSNGTITLAPDFRRQLATMAARADVLRLFHERLNQGARTISPLQQGEVKGVVMQTGYHDRDLQSSPFTIIRDQQGHEHYSRLSAQATLPSLGTKVTLTKDGRGNVRLGAERQNQRLHDASRAMEQDIGQPASAQASKPALYAAQPTESLKDQLERQIKSQLGIHKYFLGIKTTQTEGIYRGTLDMPQGKFAIIDRGGSVAALRVNQIPAVQIGAEVSASIGQNGLAQVSIELGLGL